MGAVGGRGAGLQALNTSLDPDLDPDATPGRLVGRVLGRSRLLLASVLHRHGGESLLPFGTVTSTYLRQEIGVVFSLDFTEEQTAAPAVQITCQSCKLTEVLSTTMGCLPFLRV